MRRAYTHIHPVLRPAARRMHQQVQNGSAHTRRLWWALHAVKLRHMPFDVDKGTSTTHKPSESHLE
eukprot:10193290-Lingulodinium_polyedra.AAC.1